MDEKTNTKGNSIPVVRTTSVTSTFSSDSTLAPSSPVSNITVCSSAPHQRLNDGNDVEAVTNRASGAAEATPKELRSRFELLRDLTEDEIEALEKSLVRKLDWRMLSCITIMYLMNHLDRSNISNARLAHMQTHLHLTDLQWNTSISTFFIGYFLAQLPGNLLLTLLPPRLFLPLCMAAWSICTILTPLVTNFAGLATVRSMLGICEAPFFPGIALLTSAWYTKQEMPSRMAVWHAGSLLATVVSGVLATGVLENMEGIRGLRSWQWYFLLEGPISIAVAGIGWYMLPNFPTTTSSQWSYLSSAELQVAQFRIRRSNGGVQEEVGGLWDGLKMALREPFTWLFCALHTTLAIAISFGPYLPSILKTFGWGNAKVYLMQIPPTAIAYVAMLLIAESSQRRANHAWHMLAPFSLAAIGMVLLTATPIVAVRYTGVVLIVTGIWSGFNLQLSWETALVPAPRAKKASLIAIANCASQLAHWVTPHAFGREQEPMYRIAGGVMLGGIVVSGGLVLVIWWRVRGLNRGLEERDAAEGKTAGARSRAWRYMY